MCLGFGKMILMISICYNLTLEKTILNLLLFTSTGKWVPVYSGLFDWNFENSDGWQTLNGTPAQILNCNINHMNVIYLDVNFPTIVKTFTNLSPHYEAKVQADVYYLGSWDNELGIAYIESTQFMNRSYNFFSNMPSFNNQCGIYQNYTNLQIATAGSTISHTITNLTLKFTTTLNDSYTNEAFNFRNVQLWLNLCHETCTSCYGSSSSNCLTCHFGSPIEGKCLCTTKIAPFFQYPTGCVQTCYQYYLLSGQVCYQEIRKKQFQPLGMNQVFMDFYWKYSEVPISSEGWSFYQNQIMIPFQSYNCSNWYQAGLIEANEYIQKQYTLNPTTAYIKFCAMYHFYGIRDQYSSIWVTFDDELIDVIYFDEGKIKTLNSILTERTINWICYPVSLGKNCDVYVTQQLIKWRKQNLQITFRNSYGPYSQYGLRDVQVEAISCSNDCQTCKDESNCYECNLGYYLLKGQCVSLCPLHSTQRQGFCIDQSDETPYTSYLLKAFYLETSPDTEATDYFSLISQSGTNFVKGVYYSYLRNKRIFGGALTWYSAKFRGTYSISAPHYQVRVKMLVVLGDDFGNGQFKYSINEGAIYTINRSSPADDIHQEWGNTYPEYFYQVDKLIEHSNSTLTVDVECIGDSLKQVNESFCGIANYFITVNECGPLCIACTSQYSCISWISSPNFELLTHTCKAGYHADLSTRSCQADPVCGNGIKEDGEQCDDGNEIQFDGCYECRFSCSQSLHPNCPIFKTKKQNCSSGFQVNSFNNICYPVCGDNIIAGDEECEDNNFVPFDGCHLCKYQCQESCQTCTKGVCYHCKSGWNLTSSKRCEPICKDGVKEFDEECDDKIYVDQNKCNNCKFNCPDDCSTCKYGVCLSCQNGFSLNQVTNKCTFIQNDLVTTKYEQCDDGNFKPFDACYQNSNTCQSSCLECNNGQCYKCKSGFSLNLKTCICTSRYGDNLVKRNEVCDDYNSLIFSQCYSCEFTCPDKCTICNYGICQACSKGYYLNSQLNKCQSYCGDKIVVDSEDCDDGNLIPEDGCHNCQFYCQESCLECRNGLCYKCQVGWEINEQLHRCTSICGDGLITTTEICEDGIYGLFSVCYQCQLRCPNNCVSCLYGHCLNCSKGFSLDQSRNSCIGICGDKEVVGLEECDDGNLIPYDGCHECKYLCQYNCLECRNGKCYRCEKGWLLNQETYQCNSICGDQYLNTIEVCDESIYQLYDNCQQCQFACPLNCLTCHYGRCSKCQLGFGLNQSINQCEEICGDGIRVDHEECDDRNLIPHDGCHDCKYQCQRSCVECQRGKCFRCKNGWFLNTRTHLCQSICDDSIQVEVEECESGLHNIVNNCSSCKLRCSSDCQVCSYGMCLSCKTGFLLDESTNGCNSICGDGLITQYEECDYSDNCVNCKLICQDSCQVCVKGKCYWCQQGWEWNKQTYKCDEVCGDALLVGSEVCDGSLLDQCYQCRFTCTQDCLRCLYGKCIECQSGFHLTSANQCEAICGDGIIVNTEECDNGNLFSLNGCHNCKFQCDYGCVNCVYGDCINCDQGFGWILQEPANNCETFCGDGIVAGWEQCDQTDTGICSNCILVCDPLCATCQLGKCTSCIEGYWLFEHKNSCISPKDCPTEQGYQSITEISDNIVIQKCQSVCGDGILTPDEECELGRSSSDQCINCQLKCPNNCLVCKKKVCVICESNFILNTSLNICQIDCLHSQVEQCETIGTECAVIENKCQFKEYYCEDYNHYDLISTTNGIQSPCDVTLEGYKCILENNVCRSMLCSDLKYCDSTQLTINGFDPIPNKCLSTTLDNGNLKCIEKPIHCFLCSNKECCYEAQEGKCSWLNLKCQLIKEMKLSKNRISIFQQNFLLLVISGKLLFSL